MNKQEMHKVIMSFLVVSVLQFTMYGTVRKMNKERVCMNPDCKDCDILIHYKCSTNRPIAYLARTCWNCGKSEFLE